MFSNHARTPTAGLSPADFHEVRQTAIFAGAAAYYREGHEFNGSAGPENLEGLFVSAGYFELLGGRMVLGRTFTQVREGGRSGGPGGRSIAWHRGLVVVQIALCFALLVCAALLVRTFHHLQRTELGFEPQGVLTMTFDLPGAVTRYGRDAAARASFHDRLLTRLRAHPGVVSAGRPCACRSRPSSMRPIRRFCRASISQTSRRRSISDRWHASK